MGARVCHSMGVEVKGQLSALILSVHLLLRQHLSSYFCRHTVLQGLVTLPPTGRAQIITSSMSKSHRDDPRAAASL